MKRSISIIILSLIIFCAVSCSGRGGDLQVHFIDVGKGDCIFIQTPHKKAVLVDTGNLISGHRVVQYLKEHNVEAVDRLVLTHHDFDHVGGAFFVLQMMSVKQVHDNGQDLSDWKDYSDIYRWYEELVRKNDGYSMLRKGDAFTVDGVTFTILWPPKPLVFSATNPNSFVIMVKYGKFKCLLTGDATVDTEKELLKAKIDLKAAVLKVGHHGAGDASSQTFLKAVSAPVGVISVNKRNIRGYPSQDAIERLLMLGSRIYRTDKQGDIVITAQRSGRYRVNIQKKESF